jgi:hypothetical protein
MSSGMRARQGMLKPGTILNETLQCYFWISQLSEGSRCLPAAFQDVSEECLTLHVLIESHMRCALKEILSDLRPVS